jgi:hypothetical protein
MVCYATEMLQTLGTDLQLPVRTSACKLEKFSKNVRCISERVCYQFYIMRDSCVIRHQLYTFFNEILVALAGACYTQYY